MKIAAITITSNREAIIKDAVDSVKDLVDGIVVVDMGIKDSTLDIIKNTIKKVNTVRMEFKKTIDERTTSECRNAGLVCAKELGYDWAITLDTDERMLYDCDVRRFLENTKADVILAHCKDGSYSKERFNRLSSCARFIGDTHEMIAQDGATFELMTGFRFDELKRPPKEAQKRARAIIKSLQRILKADPSDSRQWGHLADAYLEIMYSGGAIKAFQRAIATATNRHDAAWYHFKIAYELLNIGKIPECLQHCAQGLIQSPGHAELAVIAGYASLRLRDPISAIQWSNMAISNSIPNGASPRPSWSWPDGLWEAPYDVISQAFEALGHPEQAEHAAATRDGLKSERLNQI